MSTSEFVVPACADFFDTKVPLRRGVTYRIDVPPGQHWVDWFVRCGPEGKTTWLQSPFRPLLRVRAEGDRRAEFFTLIGTVGRTLDHAFIIGAGPRIFRAPTDGNLFCFANDVPGAYWNNRGAITIHVTEETGG
jgi:hypothetical protein